MRLKPPILMGATLALLVVAGCKKAEEQPPAETMTVEQPAPPVEAPPPPAETPAPVVVPKAEAPVIEPPPVPEPSPDQQVLDDADATGMTARVSRGDDQAAPTGDGNSQQ